MPVCFVNPPTAPTLTPDQTALYTQRLTEAELALHQLRMGANVTRIRHNDRDIGFSAANIVDLEKYVNELRAMLGLPLVLQARTPWRRPAFR